jgi:thiamine kinase-like enzyme
VLTIKHVEPLAEHGGSGQVFKLTSTEGKFYKLRYCVKLKRAREIEASVKKFPKAFPEFHGREGRYLLFSWIDAEHLTKDMTAKQSYALGKLLGEIHELNDTIENKRMIRHFESKFKEVKKAGVFPEEVYQKLEERYNALKQKMKVDIVLEYADSKPYNFMIEKKTGRIYLVDEDGFMHCVKAFGFSGLMRLISESTVREAFWKGYNEHHSSSYFDKDYEDYTSILSNLFLIGKDVAKGKPPKKGMVMTLKKIASS